MGLTVTHAPTVMTATCFAWSTEELCPCILIGLIECSVKVTWYQTIRVVPPPGLVHPPSNHAVDTSSWVIPELFRRSGTEGRYRMRGVSDGSVV